MIFIHFLIIFILFIHPTKATLPISYHYTFITFNLNNYGAETDLVPLKDKALVELMQNEWPSLIALQEIKETATLHHLAKKTDPYALVTSPWGGAGEQHLGVFYDTEKFILLKTQELFLNFRQTPDRLRPVFWVSLKNRLDHKRWEILVVHLKAGGWSEAKKRRSRQFKYLSKQLETIAVLKTGRVIILGDFNTTDISKVGEEEAFTQFVDHKKLHGSNEHISCSSYFRGKGSLLDHILLNPYAYLGIKHFSSEMINHCKKKECGAYVPSKQELNISDHCPVVFKMND